jgi:thiamine-phosphate pyrophosphorylase
MLVTDASRCRGELLPTVAAALAGGVNVVQLRDRQAPAGALLRLARGLRALTRGRALLVVNDRLDVALLAGADGVHLGEEGLPVAAARAWLPSSLLVGRSVHAVETARQAEAEGADYLVAGTLFPSRSHPDAVPAGLGFLRRVVAAVSIPVAGIGGIGPAEAGPCRRTGAAGVAVVDAVLSADCPTAAAAALRAAMEETNDPVDGQRPGA